MVFLGSFTRPCSSWAPSQIPANSYTVRVALASSIQLKQMAFTSIFILHLPLLIQIRFKSCPHPRLMSRCTVTLLASRLRISTSRVSTVLSWLAHGVFIGVQLTLVSADGRLTIRRPSECLVRLPQMLGNPRHLQRASYHSWYR